MKLLTVATLARLKPMKDAVREVRDSGAPGLRLAIQPSGHKSWILRGNQNGKSFKLTLGPLDMNADDDESAPVLGSPLTLSQARILGTQLARSKAKGDDVAGLKRQQKLKRAEADRFGKAVVAFIEERARPKTRSWRITARVLGLDYPAEGGKHSVIRGGLVERWNDKPIAAIGLAEIHIVVREARRMGTPGIEPRNKDASDARGRQLLACLSALFSWCIEEGLITANPCLEVSKPPPGEERERVLTDAEIRKLWHACEASPSLMGKIVQLLLLTAQRRREVSGMRWSELSDDLTEWNILGARTKNKHDHSVPLSPLARSIIGTVPRIADVDFVFSITHRSPVSGFSKFKDRLDATLGIAPWRLHDLRRTAATGMGNLNADLHVIERLLNHSSGSRSQLSRIYNKAKYTEASRNAMERWAERVAKVVESRVAEK